MSWAFPVTRPTTFPVFPASAPKTAQTLIKTYGSMDRLYEKVDSIKQKKQHENLVKFKSQALMSKKLVTIKVNAPLTFEPDAIRAKAPDHNKLYHLFKTLEFSQLQKQFPKPTDLTKKDYRCITEKAALSALVEELEQTPMFALDTETTSPDPMLANLVGLSVALKEDCAYYIPCAHVYDRAPKQLKIDTVLNGLRGILENPNIQKIGQNIKYDWIVLKRLGITLNGVVFDTMLASYLINPAKRTHGLDRIAMDFLDHKTISYAEVIGKGTQAKKDFSQVPLEKATPYACEDADLTLKIYHLLVPMLAENQLTQLMEEVEMPLVSVLMEMEMTGICLDKKKLNDLSKSFEHQLDLLESQIYTLAGEKFNIQSSMQLGEILFEKLKLPVQKKTQKKTAYSTDVSVLTTLAEKHELPAIILRYRSLAKLKSTYADALLDLIHPETGRIHTSFNQTVAATGRLSSSNPNLQNIPIRTEEGLEIRKAFVPRKGWILICADYSQIELRILSHCADDEIMLRAFANDEDIHTRTATEVFDVFPEMVTPDLRRQAKAINFGIVYGMSPYGLSKQLNISLKMAKTYIENYFRRYKGVQRFMQQAIEDARHSRHTNTLLGRTRPLPDINSTNKRTREAAERIAINTPIQGTAADLIKLAMIKVNTAFHARQLKTAMLLSVHDEILFEVPCQEVDTVKRLAVEIMETVWDLKVPLKVNLGQGANWAQAH
jgi:DNA polymerase-1